VTHNYIAPTFKSDAYHCPHCNVYAHQTWNRAVTLVIGGLQTQNTEVSVSKCSRCEKWALWYASYLVHPRCLTAPLPAEDMPDDVKADYSEAREVLSSSPRAAVALLRLALQKLTIELGESGDNLNNDIGSLVRKGLLASVQKALDAVRVIGNNAVHPGQIDLKDDQATAIALFGLVNTIVEQMITQPRRVDELYRMLPESAREAIVRRDSQP